VGARQWVVQGVSKEHGLGIASMRCSPDYYSDLSFSLQGHATWGVEYRMWVGLA